MVIVLYITLLVNSLVTFDPRQRFPVGGQGDLVDKRWLITDNMVTKRKAEREKTERYSARGTGKQMLKILYQNGGNVTHTYNMIGDIETMLNANRPHIKIYFYRYLIQTGHLDIYLQILRPVQMALFVLRSGL